MLEVDKDFLFKILNQVDSLTLRVKALEDTKSKITFEEFVEMYNTMVERNLKNLGLSHLIPPSTHG